MAAVLVLAALAAGGGTGWAKGPKKPAGPMLWIAADRIVGFAPLTVFLYGRLVGTEPGKMELCRSQIERLTDPSERGHEGGRFAAAAPAPPRQSPCAAGKVVRTAEGYDYSHDLKFEEAGTYQVRLMMVDAAANRIVSNIVQVNAL